MAFWSANLVHLLSSKPVRSLSQKRKTRWTLPAHEKPAAYSWHHTKRKKKLETVRHLPQSDDLNVTPRALVTEERNAFHKLSSELLVHMHKRNK